LWCVGPNAHGQLGDGSSRDAAQPVRVAAAADVRWSSVAVGGGATCGRHTDGTLWCWGDNTVGQLGDGTNSSRAAPVAVEPAARWLKVAVDTHVCAVRADHTLWCWGAARQGQMGEDLRADQASPRRLGTGSTWADVAVGPTWTCGIAQDGHRQCWGTGYPPAAAG
jgi:alpha-tubulin suppressor-like RCC1 family protein